jgi:hypothetical protein
MGGHSVPHISDSSNAQFHSHLLYSLNFPTKLYQIEDNASLDFLNHVSSYYECQKLETGLGH